jgi:hypothetical protein
MMMPAVCTREEAAAQAGVTHEFVDRLEELAIVALVVSAVQRPLDPGACWNHGLVKGHAPPVKPRHVTLTRPASRMILAIRSGGG